MANRYYVFTYAGSGSWDTTNTQRWAATPGGPVGASVPTAADDVFFNADSGTVSIVADVVCKSLTTSGWNGSLSIGGSGSRTLTVHGAFVLAGSGSLLFNFSFTVVLAAASGSYSFGLGGKLNNSNRFNFNVTVSGAATWTFADSFFANTLQQSVGAINTGSQSVTVNNWSVSGSPSITLGSSTVIANGWSVPGSATVSAASSTINAGTNDFSGGGKVYGTVVMSASVSTISNSGGSISSLQVTSGGGSLYFNDSFTITTLSLVGSNANTQRIYVAAAATIAATNKTLTNVSFAGFTGSGTWSGTSLEDLGGNTGITFTAPVTRYAVGAGNWAGTAVWSTSSGGGAGASMPLTQDTVIFNASSGAITYNRFVAVGSGGGCATLTCTGYTNTLTLSNTLKTRGDVTFSSGMTLAGSSWLHAPASTGRTLATNNCTFTLSSQVQFFADSSSHTTSVTGNLLLPATTTISLLRGNYTFSGDVSGSVCTVSNTMTLSMGSGTWTLAGTGTVWNCNASATVTASSASITLSNTTTTARTFAGASKSYGKLTIGGATGVSTLTITGTNTFAEIASTKTVAHTIIFPATVTTTIGKWSVSGSAGNLVTVRAPSTTNAVLTYNGTGVVSANFLSVTRITGNPDLTWYVGANSTNGGNNLRIYFVAAPVAGGNGLFFGSNF
jgi:hypothetical protein